MNDALHPVITDITNKLDSLTPKSQTLGNYIMQNPSKVVFMTTKELAETCEVSEATVVRFVASIGYHGYSEFQQSLKDFVNTGMSLPERVNMKGIKEPGLDRLHRGVLEELNNLKYMYETIDVEKMNQFVEYLNERENVFVTGSRLSYTFAYYLGWSLTKIRKGIHILKGSDSTVIDFSDQIEQTGPPARPHSPGINRLLNLTGDPIRQSFPCGAFKIHSLYRECIQHALRDPVYCAGTCLQKRRVPAKAPGTA